MKTDDLLIILREMYWKDVLLTGGEYGYNKNWANTSFRVVPIVRGLRDHEGLSR